MEDIGKEGNIMYALKDNDIISENICGNNFEYILKDNKYFAETDFKVLQSQNNGIFVKCMKMTKNGMTDLYYISNEYIPMSSMLNGINSDVLINLAVNIFASVLEVKNNGFLTCRSIDLSWDKIFVEKNTLKIKLVYLPVNIKIFDNNGEFESELRSGMVKLINKVIQDPDEKTERFVADLTNGSMTLEDVYNRSRNISGNGYMQGVRNGRSVGHNQRVGNGVNRMTSANSRMVSNAANNVGAVTGIGTDAGTGIGVEAETLKLIAMNAPDHFELIIDRDNVVIGKKQELVDLVIPYNRMISRRHCRIERGSDGFYISDEGSANGTFVDGVRVKPGQRAKIKSGDIVRLADSDFRVE